MDTDIRYVTEIHNGMDMKNYSYCLGHAISIGIYSYLF